MKKKARSEYGARLYAARKHAELTQTALAKSAGMSQSAYAEAESIGQSSTYTAQLAAACGINPHWLATGEGSMLSGAEERRPEADELGDALEVLTKFLLNSDEDARLSLEPLLASMAREPQKAQSKVRLILRLLVTKDEPSPESHDVHPTRHISGGLGNILDLGDKNGQRDTAAASAGGKSKK